MSKRMTIVANEVRASPPPAQIVHIGNFTFNQPALTVRPGTTVTWVNKVLIAFARVTLAPGERRTVNLTIPQERLSLIDAYERRVVERRLVDVALRCPVGPDRVDAGRP